MSRRRRTKIYLPPGRSFTPTSLTTMILPAARSRRRPGENGHYSRRHCRTGQRIRRRRHASCLIFTFVTTIPAIVTAAARMRLYRYCRGRWLALFTASDILLRKCQSRQEVQPPPREFRLVTAPSKRRRVWRLSCRSRRLAAAAPSAAFS